MSTAQITTIVAAVCIVIVVFILTYKKTSEDEDEDDELDVNYSSVFGTGYSRSRPKSRGGTCFSGDSIVTMGDGSFKRISEVKVGDGIMSGKSKETVKVIALFGELIEKGKLFGMNGIAPFATTDHCFLTPSYKFSCIDTEDVMQIEHKNEKDVVQLEEGTELLLKQFNLGC